MLSAALSCGYRLLSSRQASFSVRCRWNTLTLNCEKMSTSRLSSARLMYVRPTSIIQPRTRKLGQSTMRQQGMRPLCVSCFSVCRAFHKPCVVTASTRIPFVVTVNRYASFSFNRASGMASTNASVSGAPARILPPVYSTCFGNGNNAGSGTFAQETDTIAANSVFANSLSINRF